MQHLLPYRVLHLVLEAALHRFVRFRRLTEQGFAVAAYFILKPLLKTLSNRP